MIYIVVPEGVDDADEWNLWAHGIVQLQGYPTETAANEQARSLAKQTHTAWTVRKVVVSSYHRGRP